jgi:eukaryotic-like serine/threonine-protein kinase
MSPELWQRALVLFGEALAQPDAERTSWLENRCGADKELLALVQNMLSTDAEIAANSIIPASTVLAQSEQPELNFGDELGPYRIVSFLGAGGMGQVFRAERVDGVVTQAVAVKLLRHSASAAELRRRFAIERRILARLNHPGIARFIDAGADAAGRPFVVMELIEGVSITNFARTQKLGLKARLNLFAQVLEAVAYAHSQLIVHRDIKPGNVLVDAAGTARLLDFGIAKPLSDIDEALRAEGATETTMRAFSLKYAAPEQLKGEAIGVGCDIYALGGLLCELLTDLPALDLKDLPLLKAQERIFHQMPEAPSARKLDASIPYSAKELKGDLDRMALHALKKEAHERYATVDAFAADVRSHLRQEPISLRSGVSSYRLWKFVQRHKLPVALAGSLILGLLASSAAMYLQQQRLKVERDNALSQQTRAEQVTQLLTDAFEAADPSKNRGNEVKARQVLDQAARRLKDTQLDPDAFVKLSVTLANVYRSLGLLQEGTALVDAATAQLANIKSPDIKMQLLHLMAANFGDIGKPDKRAEIVAQAAQLKALVKPELMVAQEFLEMDVQSETGSLIEHIQRAKLFDQMIARQYGATSTLAVKTAQYYLNSLASIDRSVEALKVIEERLRGTTIDALSPDHLALVTGRIEVLTVANRFEEALADVAIAKKAIEKLWGTEHRKYASIVSLESRIYRASGNYPRAKILAMQCIEILHKIYPADFPIHALALNNLANIQKDMGELGGAEKNIMKVIEQGSKIWPAHHANMLTFRSTLAEILLLKKEYLRAELIFEQVINTREGAMPIEASSGMKYRIKLCEIYSKTNRIQLAIAQLKILKKHVNSGEKSNDMIKSEQIIDALLTEIKPNK